MLDHADCEGHARKEISLRLIGLVAPPDEGVERAGPRARRLAWHSAKPAPSAQAPLDSGDRLNPAGPPHTVHPGIVVGMPNVKLELQGEAAACSARLSSTKSQPPTTTGVSTDPGYAGQRNRNQTSANPLLVPYSPTCRKFTGMTQSHGSTRSLRGDIVFTFILAFACYLAWLVRDVLMLVYVSALFAVVLSPVVRWTAQIRIGRDRRTLQGHCHFVPPGNCGGRANCFRISGSASRHSRLARVWQGDADALT